MVQFRTTDGVRVQWEGAKADATTLNCWGHDYVRAECRDATLILDDRELTRQPVDDAGPSTIPLQDRELWTNAWLIEQFVEWLDGREPMATKVSANLQ